MADNIPVFDGHNDYISRRFEDPKVDLFSGEGMMHISLDALRAGGVFGGLFAIFVPPTGGFHGKRESAPGGMPPRVDLSYARRVVVTQFALLLRMIEQSDGAFRLATTVEEIEAIRDAGSIAVVAHVEGADGIAASLEELDLLYAAGLRSIGPVWSRHNRFGHGVPIFGESTPDTGPGLTSAGKRLVRRCTERGIVVDLSHITERGFRDVARISGAPLVASHSNAWHLCRSPRNLTDAQLDAIARSDGFVGLNFGTIFLRADRAVNPDTPLTVMIDHLRYLVDRLGVERVGFGSDFDGAGISAAIGNAAGMPHLIEAMRTAGFSESEINGIAWRNWLAVLRRIWGR
ncbi:MAG: dipeptidase [Spirochaeta sp.]|nr:dipeptidase [Spirochaeta sp.]